MKKANDRCPNIKTSRPFHYFSYRNGVIVIFVKGWYSLCSVKMCFFSRGATRTRITEFFSNFLWLYECGIILVAILGCPNSVKIKVTRGVPLMTTLCRRFLASNWNHSSSYRFFWLLSAPVSYHDKIHALAPVVAGTNEVPPYEQSLCRTGRLKKVLQTIMFFCKTLDF